MLIRIAVITNLLSLSYAYPNTASTVTGQRSYCDNEPCQNGGTCHMQPNSNKYFCDCEEGWNGKICDIPNPKLTCGTNQISVLIDKRMLSGHNLDNNAQLISFGDTDDEKCTAKLDGDFYKLLINGPFNDNCGTVAGRANGDSGDYLFTNQVFWKKVYNGNEGEAAIQRRIKLVDFTCNYEDEYLLQMVPLKPAESVIEEQNSKGLFKVDMTLWKNSNFEKDVTAKYSSNPIVRVGQEICVKLELDSKMEMDNLVLTAADCWASGVDNPSEEERHYIIQKKCKAEEDYTTTIKQNGISDTVKFCFKVYKWEQQMDDIFVQCRMSVCDDSVQIDGSSQCVCPPTSFESNSWFYPNYYGAQMEKMADQFVDYSNNDYGYEYFYTYGSDYGTEQMGEGLYADTAADLLGVGDNNYDGGQFFYYDYLAPAGSSFKRRRRSTENSEEKDSAEEPDMSKTLPKADGNPFRDIKEQGDRPHKRKRLEMLGTFKKDEEGNIQLPPGLTLDPKSDMMQMGYGPIHIKEKLDPKAIKEALSEVVVAEIEDDGEWFESSEGANNVILMAVGGSLVFALIVLGVVVGVYVQFKNQADSKAANAMQEQQKVKAFYQGVMGQGGKSENTFVREPVE